MKWFIQKSSRTNKNRTELFEAAEKSNNSSAIWVEKPIEKFMDKYEFDNDTYFLYGGVELLNEARNNSFLKDFIFYDDYDFTMENYIKKWGKNNLNYDGKFMTIEDFFEMDCTDDCRFFIRPNETLKTFPGVVDSYKNLCLLLEKFIQKDSRLNNNSRILVCNEVEISKEWRNVVINNSIISSTRYMKDGCINHDRNDVPIEMIEYCENLCDIYSLSNIFVMDIALSGGEYKLIECNTINCSGLCDIDKEVIVSEIEKYYQIEKQINF